MSNTIASDSTASLQALARSIMQNFDTNKDGQFSLDEFGSFLNSFVKTVSSGATGTAGTASSVQTTPFLSALANTTSATSAALPDCPLGWDSKKWYDPSHTSIKYVAGRIMARYNPSDWLNPTTQEKILGDFRAAGLNPTASGKDCVDFNDGHGPIDIVQGASIGGKAWQWLPTNAG